MKSETSESRTPVHGEAHTPGPWRAWPVKHEHSSGMIESQIQIVSNPADGPVSHLATMVDCDGYSAATVEANARLICAASQMLKACILAERWMLEGMPGPHRYENLLEVIRAAIHAATDGA